MSTQWCSLFLHNPRVLVIDDDHDYAALVGDLFRTGGAEVQEAYDGAAGLVAVRKFDPDLVICDLSMPFLAGDKVLMELRKTGFQKPFILLTGFGDMNSVADALQLNAFDFLSKPIPKEVLVAVAQKAFRQEHERLLHEEELSQLYELISATPPSRHGSTWKEIIIEKASAHIRARRKARAAV